MPPATIRKPYCAAAALFSLMKPNGEVSAASGGGKTEYSQLAYTSSHIDQQTRIIPTTNDMSLMYRILCLSAIQSSSATIPHHKVPKYSRLKLNSAGFVPSRSVYCGLGWWGIWIIRSRRFVCFGCRSVCCRFTNCAICDWHCVIVRVADSCIGCCVGHGIIGIDLSISRRIGSLCISPDSRSFLLSVFASLLGFLVDADPQFGGTGPHECIVASGSPTYFTLVTRYI